MNAEPNTSFSYAITPSKTRFCTDGADLQTYIRARMPENALREIDRLIWEYECWLAEFDGWCGDYGAPDLPGGYTEDDIDRIISMLNTLPPLICAGDFSEADIRVSNEMFRRGDGDIAVSYLYATRHTVGRHHTTRVNQPQTAEGNGK